MFLEAFGRTELNILKAEQGEKAAEVPKHGDDTLNVLGLKINRRIAGAVFLVLFILVFVIQDYTFIKMDTAPKRSDGQITHLGEYYNTLVSGKKNFNLLNLQYPPIAYLGSLPALKLFGPTMESARLGMIPFLIIFLIAMFGIGYELGGYWAGVAVMALGGASPHILNYSRLFYLDFPQTAMTALAFYLLLKSKGYRNRLVSILFGLALTLSFLTKWSTAFFMIIPVLWFLIPAVFSSKRAFLTFLAYLAPASVSVLGLVRFFKGVGNTLPQGLWLKTYIWYVLIPGVFCFITLKLLELHWKKNTEGDFTSTGEYRIFNFAYLSLLWVTLTTPWYLIVSPLLKNKFFYDTNAAAGKATYFFRQYFFDTMYSFAPILVLAGIVFIFLNFRKNWRNLLLPLNIIFVMSIMGKFAADVEMDRYILSLVIFGAALGGYWVANTGKAQKALALLLLAVSLLSIMSWTVVPVKEPLFYTFKNMGFPKEALAKNAPMRILSPGGPINLKYDMSQTIDYVLGIERNFLKSDEYHGDIDVAIYLYNRPPEFLLNGEDIKWQFMAKGGNIEIKKCWTNREDNITQSLNVLNSNWESVPAYCDFDNWRFINRRNKNDDTMKTVRDIIIIKKKDRKIDRTLDTLIEMAQCKNPSYRTFNINDEYQSVVLSLKTPPGLFAEKGKVRAY